MVVVAVVNRFYNPFMNFNYPHYIYKKPTCPPGISKSNLNDIEEKNTNKPIIELLGIKLYKDDILILLLIYFLYMEKNNDFILYILLFSLILS